MLLAWPSTGSACMSSELTRPRTWRATIQCRSSRISSAALRSSAVGVGSALAAKSALFCSRTSGTRSNASLSWLARNARAVIGRDHALTSDIRCLTSRCGTNIWSQFPRAAELNNYDAKDPHKVRAFLSCHLDGSREKRQLSSRWCSPRGFARNISVRGLLCSEASRPPPLSVKSFEHPLEPKVLCTKPFSQ